MRWFLAPAAAGILLAVLSGCNKSDTYLAVVRDQLRAQEDLAELLSTVKDKATMEAARPSVRRLNDRFEELSQKALRLPKPSAAVQERVVEELGDKMNSSMKRLMEERARICALPGGEAFMKDLEQGK